MYVKSLAQCPLQGEEPGIKTNMNLFTYGTLMDPEVWDDIAQESCSSQRARLEGYEVRCLRDAPYPGLIARSGVSAPGLLYWNVSAPAMRRLDEYEGRQYERVTVEVTLEDGSTATAEVYLIHPDHAGDVLEEIWYPPALRGPSHT